VKSIVKLTALARCSKKLALALMLLCQVQAFASDPPSSPTTRQFEFCRRYADGCGSSGRGYAVCEAYLKHLNAMTVEWPGNGCQPWLDPARHDFTLPEWEVLKVRDHLEWIYEMEKQRWYNTHSPTPSYETWRDEWLSKLDQQAIHPRLKRTRLVLDPTMGEDEVVAYDDGTGLGCRDGKPILRNVGTKEIAYDGYRLFVRRKDGVAPLQGVSRAGAEVGDIVMFKGRPYWLAYAFNIWPTELREYFSAKLSPFDYLHDWPKPGQGRYVVMDRCVYDERRHANPTNRQGDRK
jgi:hypothetical protein